MAKNEQCKIEFYFTRETMEKLPKENTKTKAIIISQKIKVRRTADNDTIDIIAIKASANNASARTRSHLTSIDGCPNLPDVSLNRSILNFCT
ncbi:hypothetical protein [Niabella aquatica]